MMGLLFALQFLTVIPIRIRSINEKIISRSLFYFPLVGLLLGLILAGINNLFLFLHFEELSIDIILVVSLITLTGGLHLDGLADILDAFLSRKSKEEMLEVMRDSHIGVMGVLGLVSVILLKISLLYSITATGKITALLLMCVLSRWSLVLAMFLFPSARPEGKAGIFMQQINFKIFIFSTFIAAVFSLVIWQFKGFMIMLMAGFAAYFMSRLINSRIKGITGDALGAIDELVEIFILSGICFMGKIWII